PALRYPGGGEAARAGGRQRPRAWPRSRPPARSRLLTGTPSPKRARGVALGTLPRTTPLAVSVPPRLGVARPAATPGARSRQAGQAVRADQRLHLADEPAGGVHPDRVVQ